MKRIISVLLCVLIVSCSVFIVTGVTGTTDYSSAVQLLDSEYGITGAQLVYSNTLDDTTNPPLTQFYSGWYSQGNSAVENGRWHVSMAGNKAVAFKDTLTTDNISDFAYSFEFESVGTWSNAYFVFHSSNNTPDWHTDYGSYIRFWHNDSNSAERPTLSVAGEKISNDSFIISRNKVYNVLLVVKNRKYDLYIWEKGKSVGNPVISYTDTADRTGNFTFNSYQANCYVDNIKVYDLSKLPQNISGSKLLYDNDFNRADATVPMGIAAAVENNALKVSGSNIASASGLTGLYTLSEFQFMTEYTTAVPSGMSEKWNFAGNAFSLQILPDKVSLIADETTNANFAFNTGKTYNIAVRYKGEKARVYVWEKGTLAPDAALIEYKVGKVSGDITYSADNADAVYDNIKVYDLSKVSEDNSLKKLADWNFDDPSAQIPIKGEGTYSYDNNTLRINSNGGFISTDGFFATSVSDLFWQFDYIPDTVNGNTDLFIFHEDEENRTALALVFLGNDIASGGNNIQIISLSNGNEKVLAATAVDPFVSGQLYTARVMFIGDMAYVKFWKKNAGTPASYTLSAPVDVAAFCAGDFAIESDKGNFAIDRMTVYRNIPDLTQYDEYEVEEVVKLLDYNFNDKNAEIPFKMGNNPELATLSYTDDGRLYIQTSMTSYQAVCSDPLAGKTLKNFVWQFDYETTEFSWNSDFFTFHSQGANDFNCLGLQIKGGKYCGGGDNVLIVKKVDNVATTLASTRIEGINDGMAFKIRISMQHGDIKVWIWPSDEATPEECTLQAANDTDLLSEGKTYIYGYQTFFYLDDMVLYQGNPDRALLDTKSLADRQERLLLIDTEFSDDKDLICKADKEPASVKVEDGELKVASGPQNMLYGTPILDGVEAYNISWQFDYTPHATQWNTDRFVFHSDGQNEGHALCLEVLGTGPAKKTGTNFNIVRRYSGNERDILASMNVPLVTGTTYTIRIICKEDMIYVYFWNAGSNTPTEPTLTASCTDKVVKKGKFMLQGYESNYTLDNMRLYNYHDGHQVSTVLKPLPSNVRLIDWHFNGMRGKTDFPMVMKDCLIYWQNTLKIKTPQGLAVDSKNLVGDHPLGDLCWEFQVRDFGDWSVNQFVIHSKDGGMDNCIYLLYCGEKTATLTKPTGHAEDPDCSSLRLIQVIDGNATLIGKANVELKRGKAYNLKITSLNNRIEISIGAKRTGTMSTVISAQASQEVASGTTFIKGYQSDLWLDNVILSNSAVRSNTAYEGSLYAVKE